MDVIEEAIMQIFSDKEEVILIPCKDVKHRNVLRTTAFRLRNKMEKQAGLEKMRDIGLSTEDIGGQYYLKLYLKKSLPIFAVRDGILVEIKKDTETFSKEANRILQLLIKDKKSTDEIVEILKGFNITEDQILEQLKVFAPEAELPETKFPQDMEKREKLNKTEL